MIDAANAPIDKWSLTFVGNELGADDAHVWRALLDRVLAATRRRIWFLTYTALPQGHRAWGVCGRCFWFAQIIASQTCTN
jgi:hypothetical protein